MTAKDPIRQTLGMAEMITKRYLADLSAADLLVRPVPGQNHIAWQLGHLLLSEKSMLDAIRPGASPELPATFEEGHGREQHGVDDPSKFLAPEKYLELMAAERAATRAALDAMTDAELDAPSPERFRQMAPTAGAVLALIAGHELMHAGQYVSVRRKLGKPVAM